MDGLFGNLGLGRLDREVEYGAAAGLAVKRFGQRVATDKALAQFLQKAETQLLNVET